MIKPAIVKRVQRAGYSKNKPHKCYVCGKIFQTCSHSTQDILWAVEEVQKWKLLHED